MQPEFGAEEGCMQGVNWKLEVNHVTQESSLTNAGSILQVVGGTQQMNYREGRWGTQGAQLRHLCWGSGDWFRGVTLGGTVG